MPEAENDERTDHKGIRQRLGVRDMFCVLIVVVVVQLCQNLRNGTPKKG